MGASPRRNLTGGRCQCTACGELFDSVTAFDRHRVVPFNLGEPGFGLHCLSEAEMLAKGMTRNPAGWFWVTAAKSVGNPAWWTARRDRQAPATPAAGQAPTRPRAATAGHPWSDPPEAA